MKLFAEEGAFVLVTDVEIDSGENVVAGIRASGGQAQFFKADVTQSADVQAAVDAAAGTPGGSISFATMPPTLGNSTQCWNQQRANGSDVFKPPSWALTSLPEKFCLT